MKLKHKIYRKLFGTTKYLRKMGINVGDNCNIYSDIVNSEPWLIHIGNNVTISNDVQLITHDNSICKSSDMTDFFGEIHIGNNVFVGAHSIILYGVSIADNVIIGCGSVVTKSITEPGCIYAGNPAKQIGSVKDFTEKYLPYSINIDNLNKRQRKEAILASKKVSK